MKALCICIAFLTLLVGVAGCSQPSVTSPASQTTAVSMTTTPVSTVSSTSVADAIAKASPAVVRVITENGMGSGMVIDKAGDVLTNNHVIEGSQTVNVEFSSGLKLPAIILGRDEITDLAILKVNGVNLPVVTFGDSSKLGQGEEVIAIGYPLDLAGSTTITKGIVSAFRNYDGVDYIQTDTSINPGNSGGALINLKGEVVGINVASIRTANGQTIEGMNFAIAINGTKPIIPKLIAGESILKPETWETYAHPTYGFSINYPSSWKVDESNLKYVRITDVQNLAGVDLEIITNVPNTATASVEALVDANIKQYQTDESDFKLLSKVQKNYGDAMGWEFCYSFSSNGFKYQFRHFYTYSSSESNVYGIRVWVVESEYETYSSTIDRIIASFRITQ